MSRVITYLPQMYKAIVAGVGAGSSAYAGALKDGVTAAEWAVVVGAALVTGVVTWLTHNKDAPAHMEAR